MLPKVYGVEMLTVVLISDLATAERLPEALTANFPKVSRKPFVDLAGQNNDRLVVEEGDQWLAIRRCDEIGAEYDELEMEAILSRFPAPCFVVVEGRGLGLVNRMFKHVDCALDFLVDNDSGLICPAPEIRLRIEEGLSWIYEQA
jgi:hypothetical protein